MNAGQSTNDVTPTAMRLAHLGAHEDGVRELDALAESFAAKAAQYMDIVKPAGPTSRTRCRFTFGQEIGGWGTRIKSAVGAPARRPRRALRARHRRDRRWDRAERDAWCSRARLPAARAWSTSRSCRRKTSSRRCNRWAAFIRISSGMRTAAVEISQICMTSGCSSRPEDRIRRAHPPRVQPGSSIMRKVNPAIAEMVNMVCFQVIGERHRRRHGALARASSSST